MLSSKQNDQIKHLKKLQTRKGRRKANQYVIEGPHLVEAAILSQAPITAIYAVGEQIDARYLAYPYEEISQDIAHYLSETGHSQGVFAIVEMPKENAMNPSNDWESPIVLLDAVQDPGNLGTIIRTADALGYQRVILGEGSVDLYNDKVLRAMQGSHFHLDIVTANLSEMIPRLQQLGYEVAATELNEQAVSIHDQTFRQNKWAVVLGNEGAGVSRDILKIADSTLYIPIVGQAESFNVAVAGAIIMYHFSQYIEQG